MKTISVDEYQKKYAKKKARSKFNAKGVWENGVYFASTAEYERFKELRRDHALGVIEDLRFQPTFEFYAGYFRTERWRLDYSYRVVETGKRVAEDKTGMMTARKKRLIKLFLQQYPEWELVVS